MEKKPEQKKKAQARVMTLEEVKELPTPSLQWMEFRKRGELFHQYLTRGHISRDWNGTFIYGLEWRVWSDKPTTEQRRKAKWRIKS